MEIGPSTSQNLEGYFNATSFECTKAEEFLDKVSTIVGITSEKLLSDLSQVLPKNTTFTDWRKNIFFQLSELALTTTDAGEMLIQSMRAYEYPDGKSWYHLLYNHLFFTTYEEHLPLCNFDANAPVNRERYVACNQEMNYFSTVLANLIFKTCSWNFLNSNDLPMSFQNIGAYIYYGEITENSDLTSSWKYREKWESELKETYCSLPSKNEKAWQNVLCQETPFMPLGKEKVGFWVDEIYPTISKLGSVFCDTVKNELYKEVSKRENEKNYFNEQTYKMRLFFNGFIEDQAAAVASSRKDELQNKKLLDFQNQLINLEKSFNESPSLENYKQLQKLLLAFDGFLKEKPFGREFPHIQAQINALKKITKPKEEL